VLVGKGVTFDSGGLNIKTEGHMYEMHMDMSGGASAILTLILAARLKLKKHVIALVPAVENMSASNAVRPGDIITSLSGKTIEVVDTDAEGRLILADALTYAKRYKPAVVVDIATLTGSSLSAVGTRASVLLTKDEALATRMLQLGEESGDYLWRLPLWEEYEENMKGTFADLVNLPESADARKGDVINAATFLFQFAKELDCPWAHLDIAPRMTATPSDKLAKGAAGTPIRLLIRLIETWNS
jgi:leucyl aminopeptidase